jgi:HEAT repeat protein
MSLVDRVLAGQIRDHDWYAALEAADEAEVETLLELATHEHADIRGDLVMELPFLIKNEVPSSRFVDTAIALTLDPAPRVRDYACFVLGTQWREVDTAPLREALAARLDDIDGEARGEALLGLAFRRDPRAEPRVRAALARRGPVWLVELQAAGALSDPGLHDLVLARQDGWDEGGARVAEMARRLTDPDGVGDDILTATAELYRRRAHGHRDGEAPDGVRLLGEMLDVAPHRADEVFAALLARLDGDEGAVHELRTNSSFAVDVRFLHIEFGPLRLEQPPGP